jgi:hypothetical protein
MNQTVVKQLLGSCQAIVIVFRHMSGNSFEQLEHKQLDKATQGCCVATRRGHHRFCY